jgi:SAM-dependent methyltransferase
MVSKVRSHLALNFPNFFTTKTILDQDAKHLAFSLCPENFGRALVLSEFIRHIRSHFELNQQIRVAVVGGYKDEPEIRALFALGIPFELEIFGIENDMTFLDLNLAQEPHQNAEGKFDLILCSQVWEHIWNHEAAFRNLANLISSKTLLWIACPASNRAHGSPEYYSAGFAPEYFIKNLIRFELEALAYGNIGTQRNYFATHALPAWLSVRGHRIPPVFAFSQFGLLAKTILSIRYLPRTIFLLFTSQRLSSESRFATETWLLLRRP